MPNILEVEAELDRRHKHLNRFFSAFDDCLPCHLVRYRMDDEMTYAVVRCDGATELEMVIRVKHDLDPHFKEW